MLEAMQSFVGFLIVISLLVFVHEMGHYLAARSFGISVEKFAIGFGPSLFKWKSRGTEWSISAFPLGGYVAINEEEMCSRSSWQKIVVLISGPVANFLLSFVMLLSLMISVGEFVPTAVVERVSDGSVAAQIGISDGDKIVSVNGQSVIGMHNVRRALKNSTLSNVTVVRDDERLELSVNNDDVVIDKDLGVIGRDQIDVVERSWYGSILRSAYLTYSMSKNTLESLFDVAFRQKSIANLSGAIGIANATGIAIREGMVAFIRLTIILSISLGALNLLPIPGLDGGQIFICLIEMIIRRPLPDGLRNVIQVLGISFIAIIIMLITINDIGKLFGFYG